MNHIKLQYVLEDIKNNTASYLDYDFIIQLFHDELITINQQNFEIIIQMAIRGTNYSIRHLGLNLIKHIAQISKIHISSEFLIRGLKSENEVIRMRSSAISKLLYNHSEKIDFIENLINEKNFYYKNDNKDFLDLIWSDIKHSIYQIINESENLNSINNCKKIISNSNDLSVVKFLSPIFTNDPLFINDFEIDKLYLLGFDLNHLDPCITFLLKHKHMNNRILGIKLCVLFNDLSKLKNLYKLEESDSSKYVRKIAGLSIDVLENDFNKLVVRINKDDYLRGLSHYLGQEYRYDINFQKYHKLLVFEKALNDRALFHLINSYQFFQLNSNLQHDFIIIFNKYHQHSFKSFEEIQIAIEINLPNLSDEIIGFFKNIKNNRDKIRLLKILFEEFLFHNEIIIEAFELIINEIDIGDLYLLPCLKATNIKGFVLNKLLRLCSISPQNILPLLAISNNQFYIPMIIKIISEQYIPERKKILLIVEKYMNNQILTKLIKSEYIN